ncbi:WD40-repeat-containing domain protein [Umbelopsis sp. PMI_123]|nr:WD40-repeat-containing domain protein [Umbelopsis sp. PMI_123]
MSHSEVPRPIYIFRGHNSQVNTLCWLDDKKHFCSGDLEGIIILWDIETRRPKLKWHGHTESVLSIQAVDASTLVSQGRDNHIHTWKLDTLMSSTPTPHSTLLYNSVTFCKIALCSHDDRTLIALPSHTDPGLIDVYDLEKQWRQVAEIGQEEIVTDSRDTVMCMDLFERSAHVHLLAGYESGRTILRIISGDKTATIWAAQAHTAPVLSAVILSDLVFSACSDGLIVRTKLEDAKSTITTQSKRGLEQVCIRNDAKIIATAGWDSRIRIFSAKTLKPLAVLETHRDSVYSVAFCSLPCPHHYLLGASKDHRISLWDIY